MRTLRDQIEFHLMHFTEHQVKHEAGWYFRDETGDLSGPFYTRNEAANALIDYVQNSLGDKLTATQTKEIMRA